MAEKRTIGWLLLVILVPLGVNLWGQQPFELPKVILLRTLVWLLAGWVVTDCLLRRRSLWCALRANPLSGPAGLLALALVVTTVTAVNWRLSLWGSYERAQGLVTLLTYLLLFLLAANQLSRLRHARQVITTLVAAGFPLVLFGLLQSLGWNPFGLVSDARSSAYATLGRANFLGAYLAMLTPLTWALLLIAERRWRLMWAVLLAGELLVIGLTLARSAWLATAVALAVFALLMWGPSLANRWRQWAWIGASLLFFSGPLLVLWQGQRQLGSTAARLAIWQATLALIRERPFLGYGADSLSLVFPRVYPPQLVYYQGREFFVDRAHNILLDWAVTAGFPGLLAFSLVLILFVVVVSRALRRRQPLPRRALLAAVLSAVLANLANNLVSFDVTSTAMAFWLLMGVGVALAGPRVRRAAAPAGKRPFRQWVLVGLLLVVVGTAVWQINVRPLLADVAARTAYRQAQAGQWVRSVAAAEQAVAFWPVEPAHHLLLSQTYREQGAADQTAVQSALRQAEAALQTARQMRPQDPNIWLRTAQFYAAASQTRALADNAYRQALALAPHHAVIYTAWGRAYLADGNPAAAAPLLRQAVSLDASSGEAYIYLGAAELALGRLEVALADYQEAVRLLPQSSRAYAGLANCYWLLEQPEEAWQAVNAALQHNPHNAQAIALRQTIQNPP